MASLDEAIDAAQKWAAEHRHPGRPKVAVSDVYDLFPERATTPPLDHLRWPATWPHAARAGVYLIADDTMSLRYVGKASGGNSIGARLSTYFMYGQNRQCRVVHDNWKGAPRYVVTIAVPEDSGFEAPALEEYLIRELDPPDNTVGRRR
jgi:hypothetical protein